MESIITATELARSLQEVLDRVHDQGERFLIERNGKPVATLAPAWPMPGITLRDLIVSLGNISLPGRGFAQDLEALQASQPQLSAPLWPS